jgi:hypothetical protein
VYIRARLVTLPLSSLLPAPFGDASIKVRNLESFSIQETVSADKAYLSFTVFTCQALQDEGSRFLQRSSY